MKSLKSIFKHSDRHKESSPSTSAASSQTEKRLGPAQLLDKHARSERGKSSEQSRGPRSHPQPSAPSSDANPAYATGSQLVQQPLSASGDRSVGATANAAKSNNLSEREDDTIGDDYRAYMGATSPGSAASKNSTDAEFFSLGSDRRLRTGDSEMKHNEDIADRNIEYYGANSSRHSSLRSQDSGSHLAQNHNLRRKSIAASVGSLGSVPSSAPAGSVAGSASAIQPKYSLGTGIPTEGSLVDGILPHVEDPHAPPYDRKTWPPRTPRNEADLLSKRDRDGSNHDDTPIKSRAIKKKDDAVDLREAILAGPDGYDIRAAVDGIIDLNDTEDTDRDVQWAPAVTQEVVKPHVHEVIEERIYREIHNHDVYRYIQPVYQTEILPARHFVYNANNELVEVSADQLPECTGAKQRWAVVRGEREKPVSHIVRSAAPRRELKILSDKTYMTPEGYERRETTILHPPELEDLSNYTGPVLPIEFLHYPSSEPEHEIKEEEKTNGLSSDQEFTMKSLGNALPAFRPRSSSSTSSHTYANSSASSPATKRLSIPRKPVGALASY